MIDILHIHLATRISMFIVNPQEHSAQSHNAFHFLSAILLQLQSPPQRRCAHSPSLSRNSGRRNFDSTSRWQHCSRLRTRLGPSVGSSCQNLGCDLAQCQTALQQTITRWFLRQPTGGNSLHTIRWIRRFTSCFTSSNNLRFYFLCTLPSL